MKIAGKHDRDANGGSFSVNRDVLRGVPVSLEAKLGNAAMTVDALLDLKAGSVVTLDANLSDFIDLNLNGNLVARGEIVAVGDQFGVRITEIDTSI